MFPLAAAVAIAAGGNHIDKSENIRVIPLSVEVGVLVVVRKQQQQATSYQVKQQEKKK